MNLRDVLARNLRKVRHERGLSQEALADEAGIDRTYVSALERSVYAATVDMIEKLAGALDIEPADLLSNQKPRPRR
ncbi:MAG: helix-turn-helix transcriptional regulator [Hyphomonadaceae bacterium]|nr:helix-turn-helix transcriptional regulator [Hyphomonadaceae bacterium]